MDAIADERRLLRQIAGGDKTAFKGIYDHYWDDLYNLALPFLKSTETAQDVTQEVFLKLWAKRDSLPGITDFNAYIFIMLRNEVVTALRRKNRGALHYDRYRRSLPADFLASQPMDLKELEALVREAILRLPPPQDLFIDLTRNQGLSHEEIAQKLGISKKTVSNTLTKALSNIRKYLRDHGA